MNLKSLLFATTILCVVACATKKKTTQQTSASVNDEPAIQLDTIKVVAEPKLEKVIYQAAKTKSTDIIHTKLWVNFDWENSRMNGKAEITAKPYFYPSDMLYLNARGMDIKSVKGTYQVTPTMTIEINSPLFSIYPNPSNDFWQVSIPNNQYALSYTLTDINGNIVGAELITKGNSSLKIPNTNLAIGQYILTLHTHNTYYNYSIIKK